MLNFEVRTVPVRPCTISAYSHAAEVSEIEEHYSKVIEAADYLRNLKEILQEPDLGQID